MNAFDPSYIPYGSNMRKFISQEAVYDFWAKLCWKDGRKVEGIKHSVLNVPDILLKSDFVERRIE